ncbi:MULTISPECIES: hypothetical protein [Brevibacillus]
MKLPQTTKEQVKVRNKVEKKNFVQAI